MLRQHTRRIDSLRVWRDILALETPSAPRFLRDVKSLTLPLNMAVEAGKAFMTCEMFMVPAQSCSMRMQSP